MIKNVKLVEWNISIVTVFLNHGTIIGTGITCKKVLC